MNYKILATLLLMFMTATVSMGAVLMYDGFADAPTTNLPSGWLSDDSNPVNNHGYVESGSLTYPGTASTNNSFGLGNKTADYNVLFAPQTLAANEQIYFSFLMRINEASAFSTGGIRLYDSTDQFGSGVMIGMGTSDYTTDQMGFSLNNRLRNWTNAASTNTTESYTISNATYLVVGSYTRGSSGNGSGSVSLWVNPAVTATPGVPTLTMASYTEDEDYDTVRIMSNGSGSFPPTWQMDEIKVGTEWTDVVSSSIPAALPPSAAFSANPVSGLMPLVVTFWDVSTGSITNRSWDFGDGPTLETTLTSVDHTYTVAGTYSVELLVEGEAGSGTNTQVDIITVLDPADGLIIGSDSSDTYIGLNTNGAPVVGSSGGTINGIGDNNFAFNKGDMCTVVMFELPDLGGQPISEANLAADITSSHAGGTDPFPKGVDLYAIRYAAIPTVLTNDYGFKGNGSGTLIQANVFEMPASGIYDYATYETDVSGDATLTSWLTDQYAAGAQAGDFVFFRYEVNGDTAGPVYVASSENTAQSIPTLKIVLETAAASADFVSVEQAGPGQLKLIFNGSGSFAALSLVGRNDLVLGSWGYTPHSDDGVNPFVTTNLSYSTSEGTNYAIYVETTNSAAFYGIE